jgi:hypothetical protein
MVNLNHPKDTVSSTSWPVAMTTSYESSSLSSPSSSLLLSHGRSSYSNNSSSGHLFRPGGGHAIHMAPTEYDVQLGRGKGSTFHIGNRRLDGM